MQREVSAVEAVMQGQTSAGEKARSKIRGSWSNGGVVKKWPLETAGTEVERNDELSQCSSDGWMTVTRRQKGRAGQRRGEADLHQDGREQNGHVASVAQACDERRQVEGSRTCEAPRRQIRDISGHVVEMETWSRIAGWRMEALCT